MFSETGTLPNVITAGKPLLRMIVCGMVLERDAATGYLTLTDPLEEAQKRRRAEQEIERNEAAGLGK